MAELEEIIARLNPKTRSRVHAATEVVMSKLPTPSMGLNLALAGGFGQARQTLVWGNKSSGKSSLCLQMIADAQANGKSTAWIDPEQSYDPSWARRLGVDPAKLIHSDVKTISDMTDVGVELMHSGVDIIVVDSISSLLSSAYFDKSDDLKELGGTKQIGSDARDMANSLRMLNFANKNTALVLISQIRNQIHSYGASQKPTGGHAVYFFSSTVVRLTSSAREADQITGEVTFGDKVYKEPIGRSVNWQVEYNKLGPPSRTGAYDFYYEGDFVGVDRVGEVADLAEHYGIIKKKGAWYNVYEETIQGRKGVVDALRTSDTLYGKVLGELNEQIG